MTINFNDLMKDQFRSNGESHLDQYKIHGHVTFKGDIIRRWAWIRDRIRWWAWIDDRKSHSKWVLIIRSVGEPYLFITKKKNKIVPLFSVIIINLFISSLDEQTFSNWIHQKSNILSLIKYTRGHFSTSGATFFQISAKLKNSR